MDIKFLIFIIFTFEHTNSLNTDETDNPRIIEHPMDVTVPKNEPVTLNCKVEGYPKPKIQWFRNGEELKIEPGSHRILLPAGGLFFLKVIHSRRETDAGTYWCEAKNEFGFIRSRNATLQVAFLREEFRLEPQNTRVATGETALMECGAPRGSPEPTVMWRKNGQTIDMSVSKRIRIVDGGNLAIQDARQSDDGRYQCVVKNIAGIRESSVAFLKVHVRPFLIRGPQNQTAIIGSSVIFHCRVGGDPLPDVLWRRSATGGNMPLRRVHILEDRSLKLENITLEDIGEYSCEADNAVGSVTATGNLIVYSLPKFTIRPKTQIAEIDSEVDFECQANGVPKPTVFWSFEGNNTLYFPGYRSQHINVSSLSNDQVILTMKIRRDDGSKVIICNAVNLVGSVSSRVIFTIDTHNDLPPPVIAQGPVNQTLPIKSVVTMPCKGLGDPQPDIGWYKDGIAINANSRINISENGNLVISDLNKSSDTGLYTCIASNHYGKAAWSGYLKLEIPTNPNIKFYRAPELSSYPGPPGKPQIIEKTDNSVTIQWTASGKIGASSIQGYIIEMFGKNFTDDSWKVVESDAQNLTYTHYDLVPGISYYFFVRAKNSHGVSLPSTTSEPVLLGTRQYNNDLSLSEARASLLSGDIIELLNATSTKPTTMKLTWQILNGKYVEGLYIYAREIQDFSNRFNSTEILDTQIVNSTYKMLTVLNAGASSTSSFFELEKYTTYEFFMIPFYKTVEGKPSNSRISRTMEDVPSEAPYDMEALLLNSSAVFLKWKPPSFKAHNGILLNYHIIVRGVDVKFNLSKILTNVTIDANTPTLVLANLTEGTTYTVSVAAGNKAGLGPFSNPATLRLDPITKKLDPLISQRFPINNEHMNDILTRPWFIILLCTILVIMMLSFVAMIFVKRKHLILKQSTLNSIGGAHTSNVLKIPNLPDNSNGYWLDPSNGGIVWRPPIVSGHLGTFNVQKERISDYISVCNNTSKMHPHQIPRYISEYSNAPAEYAEVSSFEGVGGPHYEYTTNDNRSHAPYYATSTIIANTGSYKNPPYQQIPPNYYPQNKLYHGSTSHENYPQLSGNRSVFSENYPYIKDNVHITENKINNLPNYLTVNPLCTSEPQTPLSTIRRSGHKFTRPQKYYHKSLADNLSDDREDRSNEFIGRKEKFSPASTSLQRKQPTNNRLENNKLRGNTFGHLSVKSHTPHENESIQNDEDNMKYHKSLNTDNPYINWKENSNRKLNRTKKEQQQNKNLSDSENSDVNDFKNSNMKKNPESNIIYAPENGRNSNKSNSFNTQIDDV